MVAIVTGNALGLELGSLATLGQRGANGSASTGGRNGEMAYVNAANGNLILQSRDEFVAQRGLDIESLRTYNSQGQFTDDNGDNWTVGAAAQRLQLVGEANAVGSSFVRTGRDGSTAVYTYDSSLGRYVTTDGSGAHDSIQISGGTWVWRDESSGRNEQYDTTTGRICLAMEEFKLNTSQSYHYDEFGRLIRVQGQSDDTYYDYTGANLTQIRSVSQSSGATLTRVRYAYYDGSNLLKSVTVDLTPNDNVMGANDPNSYTTTYTYHTGTKRIHTITQSDGSSLTFTYLQFGADFRVGTVTDALGNKTSFSYDLATRRTTVTSPTTKVHYDHDTKGNLTSVATSGPADVVLQRASYTYNSAGDVTRVQDEAGGSVDFEYDVSGNQILQRDAAGNTVTRSYTTRNQLATETVFRVADPDGSGPAVAGNAATTRYVYQGGPGIGRDEIRFEISADGRVTEYRYNLQRQRIAELSYAGQTYNATGMGTDTVPFLADMVAWAAAQDGTRIQRTDMAYDDRGQVTTLTRFAATDAAGNGIVNGTESLTLYVYDQAGQLLQTTSATGGTSIFTYDGLGRLLTSTDANSVTTFTSYLDGQNKTRQIFANGLMTTSVYDKAGRLTSVQRVDASSLGLGETKYFYDGDGRLRMTEDPTGVRHHMLYDEAGRKVADVDGNGTFVEYSYDRAGRVTRTLTYAVAANLHYLVDLAGQPKTSALSTVRPVATGAVATWNVYDAAGRLIKTVAGDGAVTETTYDGASRIVQITQYDNRIAVASLGTAPTAAQIAPQLRNGIDRITRYFHDADGRLTGMLDAEGYLTRHEYDAAGRVTFTTRFATVTDAAMRAAGTLRDLLERVVAAQDARDIRSLKLYDGKGQVIVDVDGENFVTSYSYDRNGNMIRRIRSARAFTGSITAITRVEDIYANVNNAGGVQVTKWTYDKFNRLEQVIDHERTFTRYVYDSVGRLISTTRGFNTEDARTVNVRYDAVGNLVGELTGEGSQLLTGNQTEAEINAIWAQYGLTHAYDHAGRRISTIDQNGNKTRFYYDVDGQLTHSINQLGEVEERKYNGLGQLTHILRYARRLASPESFTGGLVNTALTNAVLAIADGSQDGRIAFSYDAAGLLASKTIFQSGTISSTDSFLYNAFGNETERSTAILGSKKRVDTAQYDRLGQRVSSVSGIGGTSATFASALYDAFGRQELTIDGNGKIRKYKFDRLGRMVQSVDGTGQDRNTVYDAFGRVLTQFDALDQPTTYSYDDTARSMTVTTPEGVKVTTVRNRHGQVLSIEDGNKNVTSYAYDRNGNLKSTTTPLTSSSQKFDRANRLVETTDARGVKVVYDYDGANRVLSRRVDPKSLDPNGLDLVTSYEYNGRGLQTKVTDPRGVVTTIGYDRAGRVLTSTVDDVPGGLKLQTIYSYDNVGNVLTVTSPRGVVTAYAYDNLNRRESETVDAGGQLNLLTTYKYDANGNVVSRTEPGGKVTRYAYDGENRLLFTVDPMGGTTRNVYDNEGRVVSTTRYAAALLNFSTLPLPATADQIQQRIVATSGKDAVEARRYDRDGRLTFTVDGTGAVVKYEYDANGNITTRTAFANAVSSTWNGITDPVVSEDAARDQRVRSVYDQLNRLIYQADATGAVTQRVYGDKVNVTRVIEYAEAITPGILPTAVRKTSLDRESVFTYDKANRETWRADAAGAVTQTEYDKAGNVLSTTRFAKVVAVGGNPEAVERKAELDRVTRHSYDNANRRTFSADALNQVTGWTYDKDGNVETSTRYGDKIAASAPPSAVVPNSAIDRKDSYTYDRRGRLLTHTDALGQVEHYTYNDAAKKKTFTNKKQSTWTYEYDAAGRLVTEISPAVDIVTVNAPGHPLQSESAAITTKFVYDALGNLRSRTEASGRAVDSRTTDYEYDARGRQIKVTYPPAAIYAGESAAQLAQNGRLGASTRVETALTRLSTQTFYDTLGNAVANIDVAGNASYKAYDQAGRVRFEVDAMGYVTGHERNAFGETEGVRRYAERTSLANAVPTNANQAPGVAAITSAVSIAGIDHTLDRLLSTRYDAMGRAAEVTEPAAYQYDSTTGQDGWSGKKTLNVYNPFGELIKTSVADTNVSTHHYYDRLGRQVGTVDAMGFVTQREFDLAGNLKTLTEFARALDAGQWNATQASAPTPIQQSTDRKTTYEYDALDRKISETRFGVEVGTASGTSMSTLVTTTYGYDAVGNLTSTKDALGGSVFSYYDALGRVVAVSEPARTGAEGRFLIPLTRFHRDAHGNVVSMVQHAFGALGASEFKGVSQGNTAASLGFAAITSLEDRRTVSYYDKLGHVTEVVDPAGAWRYMSYNARGEVAKTWQPVGDVDGASRTLFQAFQYDKLGRLTHTLDPAPFTAGLLPGDTGTVTDTMLEYNAFGEVVRKGLNNDWKEFFDYDQAGRVWRTNSGDGVVKVLLHDVLGRTTAEIRSSTDDLGSITLTAGARAQQHAEVKHIALRGDTRRTDKVYDALGRVVEQRQPARSESVGGVKVESLLTSQRLLESERSFWTEMPSGDSSDDVIGWDGTNRVQLGWTSLAGLGSGEVQVELHYLTASYETTRGYVTDDTPGQGPVTHPAVMSEPVPRVLTRVFTAEEAAAGCLLEWADKAGISAVTSMVVSKKNVNGMFQKVIDRPGFGNVGHFVQVTVPNDGSATELGSTRMTLEVRWTGDPNAPWNSIPLDGAFNAAWQVDASELPAGDYEYKLFSQAVGQAGRDIASTGTLSVSNPPLTPINIPVGLNVGNTGSTVLAWQSPGGELVQTLNYRRAASMDAWSSLPVTSRGVGYDGVSIADLPSGDYVFELLWASGATSPPGFHATGTLKVVAAAPEVVVPPRNTPNVTGISVSPTEVSWDVALGTQVTLVAGTPREVSGFSISGTRLSWTRLDGQVHFGIRRVGDTDWSAARLVSVVGDLAIGDLSDLSPGDYDVLINYTTVEHKLLNLGVRRVHIPSPPTRTITSNTGIADIQVTQSTLSWVAGAGTVVFEGRRAGTTKWEELTDIRSAGGRHSLDISGLTAGGYNFRISYKQNGATLASASGDLNIAARPTMEAQPSLRVGGFEATSTRLTWTPLAGTASFEYYDSFVNEWLFLAVTRDANGQDGVDIPSVTADVDFRVTYHQGAQLQGMGSGWIGMVAGSSTPIVGAPTFQWRKLSGGDWTDGGLVSVGGSRASASIAGLVPDAYEFRIAYTEGATLVALGTVRSTLFGLQTYQQDPTLLKTELPRIGHYDATPTTLSWNAPGGNATFEYRQGNGAWTPLSVARSGTRADVDIRSLVAGSYEFRVVHETEGACLALGAGTLKTFAPTQGIPVNPVVDVAPYGVSLFEVVDYKIRWPWQGPEAATFQRRLQGQTEWISMTFDSFSSPHSVDTTNWPEGQYDFRITYYSSPTSVLAMGAGTVRVSARPAPEPLLPARTETTGTNVITQFITGHGSISWQRPQHIPSNTGLFEFRVMPGGGWEPLSITSNGQTETVLFNSGGGATAEFRITYNIGNQVGAYGGGTITIPAPQVSNTGNTTVTAPSGFFLAGSTLSWNPPSVGAGTAKFEYQKVGQSDWTERWVDGTGARSFINLPVLTAGEHSFRVTYRDSNQVVTTLATGKFYSGGSHQVIQEMTDIPAAQFQTAGTTISWAAPTPYVQVYARDLGTLAWGDPLPSSVVPYVNGRHVFNTNGMAAKTYEYRLVYTDGSGTMLALGIGLMNIPYVGGTPQFSDQSRAAITGMNVIGNRLVWHPPVGASGLTPVLRARMVNTSDWSAPLPVSANVPAGYDSYDFSGAAQSAPGAYQFRLIYIDVNGKEVDFGAGQLTIAQAHQLLQQTPVATLPITSAPSSLSWPRQTGTVSVQYRQANTLAWQPFSEPLGDNGTTQWINLTNVIGSYEFRVTSTNSNNEMTAQGTYRLTRTAVSPTALPSPYSKISGVNATPITFSWNATPGAAKSELWARIGTGPWELVPTVRSADGLTYSLDLVRVGVNVTYDYRILSFAADNRVMALGAGTLRRQPDVQPVTPAPVLSSVASAVWDTSATPTRLSWNVGVSAAVQEFECRIVSGPQATMTWSKLDVTVVDGKYGVSIVGLLADTKYEYRILHRNEGVVTARGAGVITPKEMQGGITPNPELNPTPVINLSDYRAVGHELSWSTLPGTAVFQARLVSSANNSPWGAIEVTKGARDSVTWPAEQLPGLYEFMVTYMVNGTPTALGSGTIEIHAPVTGIRPPTQVVTTPAYSPGYVIPAVLGQYGTTATTASHPVAISVATGSTMTQQFGQKDRTDQKRPAVLQEFDRWGNVVKVTDARSANWATTYTWNFDNQMLSQTLPSTTGQVQDAPVTRYYYDALGRQVAVRDANGHVNGREYDAGGNVVKERHADGGEVTHAYDALGQKRSTVDAEGNGPGATAANKALHTTGFSYDMAGRLSTVTRAAAPVYVMNVQTMQLSLESNTQPLVTTYTYDAAGRKLTERDAAGLTTRYRYDHAEHVIETRRQAKGSATSVLVSQATYDAAGHKRQETDASGNSSTWETDYFGRTHTHFDLGGQRVQYFFDTTGQLTSQTATKAQQTPQEIQYTYDSAGQLTRIVDTDLAHARKTTEYAYDMAGNRVLERTEQGGVVYQDNRLAYDQIGRLRRVADGHVYVDFQYDKVGNRTSIQTIVSVPESETSSVQETHSSTRHFQYDAMNRMTVVDAQRADGHLGTLQALGENGHKLTYDLNGNRKSDTFYGNLVVRTPGTINQVGEDRYGNPIYQAGADMFERHPGMVTEAYAYDHLDRLKSVSREGMQIDNRLYDAAGRVLQSGTGGNMPYGYADALNAGVPPAEHVGQETLKSAFDGQGRLVRQHVLRNDNSVKTDTQYMGFDLAGNVTAYSVYDAATGKTTNYANVLTRREGYLLESVTASRPGVSSNTTTNTYDASGQLVRIDDALYGANDREIVTDAEGRALWLKQDGHVQRQLVVNGEVLGQYGVGLNEMQPSSGPGQPNFAPRADFAFGFRSINGSYPAATPSNYTVRAGDSLQSIAQVVYGDSRQWYRIAEANNVASDSELRVGQTLTIPAAVTSSNDASTFEPYDPSKITGDTTPALPAPGKNQCAQIAMIVVAIIVTVVTYGAASAAGWSAVAAGAAGGAAGAVASQVVGNALGVLDGFDWKAVALGAIGGAITGGLSGWDVAGNVWINGAVRAAVGSAMSQGIGVATGLQDKFSWKGVAAAAIGGGLSAGLSEAAGLTVDGKSVAGIDPIEKFLKTAGVSMASGVARVAVSGGRFNAAQVAADAFGNALGNGIVDSMQPTQGTGAWSDKNYTNEYDKQSDRAYEARRSQEWITQSDEIQRRRMDEISAQHDRDAFVDAFRNGLNAAPQGGPSVRLADASDVLKLRGYSAPQALDDEIRGRMADLERRLRVGGGGRVSGPGLSTERMLANLSDMADAYRASGMSGATGDALVFESAALAGPGLRAPGNAFLRGLSGEYRSVLEGPASFGENAGLFTRGLVTSAYTSLYGLGSEIKGQYVDAYNLIAGAGSGYSPSSALLSSLQREGFGATVLGIGRGVLSAPSQPVIDLLDGRYEQAGAGMPGTLTAGVGIVGKFSSLRLGGGAGPNFIDFNAASEVAPGLYRADPRQLRFMQPTVSPNFSTGGHTIASTADDLRLGRVTPEQLGDPLRVVMIDGKPFSFDNRRVLSYNMAGVNDVPIQVMGLDDPVFAAKVDARFNPIEGQGLRVVVVPSGERKAAMAELFRRGMVEKPR